MKLRISTGNLPINSNPNWPATCRTLHCRHHPSLLVCRPHLPKRAVRLTNPKPPRKRSFILLHLHLPAHRTGTLLRLIPIQRNLKHRSRPTTNPHSHSLRRIRPAMRTNIILRRHSHYQPILSRPLHRPNPCRMGLRRILSRQPHTNTILHPSLPSSLHNCRPHHHSPHLPTRIGLKQPARHLFKL